MNQISSNTNNNYRLKQAQMSFKANEQLPIEQPVQSEKTIDLSQVQIPDLYYTPEDSFQQQGFKETLKKADVMGLIYPWVAHPFMMLGTCAGLAYGVDKFSKACSGDYEKSLLGKAAKFGDSVENSKFVQKVKKEPKSEVELKTEIVEENYRLAYVGITRAKKKLLISSAKNYKLFARIQPKEISEIFEGVK